MANENIQYVYDRIRFYSRALITVIVDFFRLQKEKQTETTKVQLKFERKSSRSRKAIFFIILPRGFIKHK